MIIRNYSFTTTVTKANNFSIEDVRSLLKNKIHLEQLGVTQTYSILQSSFMIMFDAGLIKLDAVSYYATIHLEI